MTFILENEWAIFIGLEIISWVCLIVFLALRYGFDRARFSQLFLALFLLTIGLEAALAYIVYQATGEIDSFQIVIFIFILYACTFGISDFKKLDRYMKGKIGKWRGIDLLTDKDKAAIARSKQPAYIAKMSLIWWLSHTLIFFIAHTIFWIMYGHDTISLITFLQDWSWYGEETIANAPFTNEMIVNISRLWIVIYVIDTIVSWSYIIFPGKSK